MRPQTNPTTEVMPRTGVGAGATTEAGATTPFQWSAVQQAFRAAEREFWLTTVNAEGRPHVAPVFAAWADSSFFVATKATARKTRDLQDNGRCVVATNTGDAHVVVEASARRVHDPSTMDQASAAFAEVYHWPTTVVDDEIDAPYSAPTSGGPPLQIWELVPVKAFGFPTDGETAAPTRWRFEA